MNKIILCEGQTDAILLSYYLGKAKLLSGKSIRLGVLQKASKEYCN